MSAKENFVDEVHVTVSSGRGGDGMISFRRGKFEPMGGPSGGDGGRGGDVVLVADPNLRTLLDIRHRREIKAQSGRPGGTRDMTGARGQDVEIRVPVGTIVYDEDEDEERGSSEESEPLVDLTQSGQRIVVCKGGNGGHGNTRFKTSTRQAPRFAKPGQPSVSRRLRLSLKLLADVGLLGFPNAGKSTLLRRISAARPRVGSYPFTTLVPSLGVVERGERRFVVADVPGLIEGASEGAGLGDRFLRHIERTRVIVHLLDCGALLFEERDLLADYEILRHELTSYRPELAERKEIVVLNKVDLVSDAGAFAELESKLEARGIEVQRISGVTGAGCAELIDRILVTLDSIEPDVETDESVETDAAEAGSAAAPRAAANESLPSSGNLGEDDDDEDDDEGARS